MLAKPSQLTHQEQLQGSFLAHHVHQRRDLCFSLFPFTGEFLDELKKAMAESGAPTGIPGQPSQSVKFIPCLHIAILKSIT